jgi:hypothetical protein
MVDGSGSMKDPGGNPGIEAAPAGTIGGTWGT